jgi:hypothetical protein
MVMTNWSGEKLIYLQTIQMGGAFLLIERPIISRIDSKRSETAFPRRGAWNYV